MKTYKEFILEANEQKELSTIRRTLRNPPPGTNIAKLNARASELTKIIRDKKETSPKKSGREARISDPERTVKNTGYAQTGKRGSGTPVSSVGTVSGVKRIRITDLRTGKNLGSAEPSDTRTSGRYGKNTGGRGTGKSRSLDDIGR